LCWQTTEIRQNHLDHAEGKSIVRAQECIRRWEPISPVDFPHAKNAKKKVFYGFSLPSPEEDSSAMKFKHLRVLCGFA
jgi:hypothetical protein